MKTPTNDEITLHLIATGLCQLETFGAVHQAYPNALQRGLNRLGLESLRRQIALPKHMTELLEWCEQPLQTWGLNLPETIGNHECLLENGIPSDISYALRRFGDLEAALEEENLMRQVFERCETTASHEAYVAFRRQLILEPALSEKRLLGRTNTMPLNELRDELIAAYAPAPLEYQLQNEFVLCANCGNLLRPSHNGLHCEEARCRTKSADRAGQRLPTKEGVYWLRRGLRRFVAAPGRAELELAERLERLGLGVELWVALDRYDLRIAFEDQSVWAIDVKDWADPNRLASEISSIPKIPSWQRGFFVVPDERLEGRSDYLRILQRAKLGKNTSALSVNGFMREVRRKLKNLEVRRA